MKNYQTEQYTVAGLLIGGFTALGTVFGAVTGFLIGGGVSEFLNQGWIWTVNGLALGSLISAGIGLLGLAIYIKNNQKRKNHQTTQHAVAGLLFGGFVVLGTIVGGLTGFLISGGASEFLNGGWILKVGGLVLGSLLSSGIGLVSWAIHTKNNQSASNFISYK